MGMGMSEPERRLRFIEQAEYRGHRIKVVRRSDELRILIYPPDAMLATRIVTDHIANHARAFAAAKALIDRLHAEAAQPGFDDLFED